MSDSPPELEELNIPLNQQLNKESTKKPDSQIIQNLFSPTAQKINTENNFNSNRIYRRNSAKNIRKKNYNLTSDRDNLKNNWVTSTKEAIEINNTMKQFQWKFGLLLNEKINSLNIELKNLRQKIEEKKIQNFNESILFERRKNELNKQIKKEEKEDYDLQLKENNTLNKRKIEILNDISDLEKKKNNIKNILLDKYKEMIKLKQNLKISIDQLDLIKKEILNRKFVDKDKTNILEKSESEDFKFDDNNNIKEIPHKLNEFSSQK